MPPHWLLHEVPLRSTVHGGGHPEDRLSPAEEAEVAGVSLH